MIAKPRIPSYTNYSTTGALSPSDRAALTRIDAAIDSIAAAHGYALPPSSSSHPSAQQVRDRLQLLRRTVPDLSNRELARLDRFDLRLHEMTNPGPFTSRGLGTAWDGAYDGAFLTPGGANLGDLLRARADEIGGDATDATCIGIG